MKKAAAKDTTTKPLFKIEHDEELEKHAAPSGDAKILADQMKELEAGKGHIKVRKKLYTQEQAQLMFGNAKAMLKREEFEGTFKSKSHKNETTGEYDYLIILRTS